MNKINLEIKGAQGFTKLQQLVHSITEAISTGVLKEGDYLPSVNSFSRETGYSRDTVFKAYKILKQRSIIQSTPTKGYFVVNQTFRVFMLLDDFSAFKEQLYRSFRDNLPGSYSADLLFHHYNQEVFRQLIHNSLGRYSMYVIMNIDNKGIDPVIKSIDPNKLLILDMGKPDGNEISYILQNFEEALFECLEFGKDRINKYNEFIMVYSEKETPHPGETTWAFASFCRQYGIKYTIVRQFEEPMLKEGQAYFVIRESELVQIIKSCFKSGFIPGKQIGILAYNDTPMKEITCGGISVVSTDFELMGKMAATFVKSKNKVFEVLPTSLILRNTL